MKQFLVLLATIPIMILFLTQITLDQVNSARYNAVSDVVYAARESAKQSGGFDEEALISELSKIKGIDVSKAEIKTDVKGTVKRIDSHGNRGMIHYFIKVPIGDAMAGSNFLGVGDDNTYWFVVDSVAPSEF